MEGPYKISFTLNGMEFETSEIESKTEMLQKREALKSVAEDVSMNPTKHKA